MATKSDSEVVFDQQSPTQGVDSVEHAKETGILFEQAAPESVVGWLVVLGLTAL